MAGPLTILVEPAKPLSAPNEVALLEAALLRHPASATLREKLARLLNELDRFCETVALLAPSLETLDSMTSLLLAQACFALNDREHLELASLAADRAQSAASGNSALARAMADQAKVKLRLGESAAAIAILESALTLDINCVAAFKRLAIQLLRQRDYQRVEELADSLIAMGICHSRALAAKTMALAAMGRDDEAREMVGIERFLYSAPIVQPSVEDDIEDFNSAFVAELIGSRAMRHDRFGTASSSTNRLDAPDAAENPLWVALLAGIAQTVENWANSLPGNGHPWLSARPQKAFLRSWCVITQADGHERWHMHPDGWLSGGYYPIIPCGPGSDTEKPGSIAFGLPDGLPGADAAARFGERCIRPSTGQLMLFPSHAYHRTYPHGRDAMRICVAFDIIPA